jgi:hypothetical protein
VLSKTIQSKISFPERYHVLEEVLRDQKKSLFANIVKEDLPNPIIY